MCGSYRYFCSEERSNRATTTPRIAAPTILETRGQSSSLLVAHQMLWCVYIFPVTVATRRAPGRNAMMNLMLYWNGDSWNQPGTWRSDAGMRWLSGECV